MLSTDFVRGVLSERISDPCLISGRVQTTLRDALRTGNDHVRLSLDLGLSESEVQVGPHGVVLPAGDCVPWSDVDVMRHDRCYVVHRGHLAHAYLDYSASGRVYSLRPTDRAPTILNAGFPMHRIQGTTPDADAAAKVQAVRPIRGAVLDTAMGLGYTAIAAARSADVVSTFEVEPAVAVLARINPWSRALFASGSRIITYLAHDVCQAILELPDRSFDVIIHDPPTFALAGEMYAGSFYEQLARIIRTKGRLYHYVGDVASGHGRRLLPGVIRRLRTAGFQHIQVVPEAVGLVARRWRP